MLEREAPLVSVLIPCFNHEAFIRRTIESVLKQSYARIEILVADDCSQDRSAEILRELDDPRVRCYFFENNGGTVHAINALLKEAAGDYIATLGSDDLFTPDKLEKQLARFEKDPTLGAVFTWASVIDENDDPYPEDRDFPVKLFCEQDRSQAEWLRYFFTDGNHFCHSSALIRRDVQEQIGPYRPAFRQLHDLEMWLRLLSKYPVAVIPEELTLYRRALAENTSVSASSTANTIRLMNEYGMAFASLFEQISPELFYEAFGDLAGGGDRDDEGFAKDRYLALRKLDLGDNQIAFPAALFFAEHVEPFLLKRPDEATAKELTELYYQDTARPAVTYGVMATEREKQLKQQNAELRLELKTLYESSSWRLTAPLRRLSSFLKKIFTAKNAVPIDSQE